jgi:hypothetical protein
MSAPFLLLLNDDDQTTRIMVAQSAGRLECRCSVCDVQVERPWELDDSGRCDECRP